MGTETVMHALLMPLGSAGDVHPYIGIGRRLRARGHHVTLITSGYFEPHARQAGLDFVALGTAQEYQEIMQDPELWHPHKAFRKFAEVIAPRLMPPIYQAIMDRHVPGQTVMAASGNIFAARAAHEKTGIPLATVHLQPASFRSIYEPPMICGLPLLRRIPKACCRAVFMLVDLLVVDRLLLKMTNDFRAQIGLRPIPRFVSTWWNSPQRVIGLFPEWFAKPQPDWPSQTRLTGFPLYDAEDAEPMPADAEAFLQAGDPPLVFTPGSPIRGVDWFFQASAEACRLLGRRGLLLTQYPEQIPANLPDGVRHYPYLPFGRLLPRCAAIVHHGGIGTMAQALAAGIPQLLMPSCNDQPDNAMRLTALGGADQISPDAYQAPRVAHRLKRLLESREVLATSRTLADRICSEDPLGKTCSLIEALLTNCQR
ncbi:MAG: glycosyltransferase [Phycisphaerae bacterium]|nr:glycosyltransferase [Phycisphaerae bacterium]